MNEQKNNLLPIQIIGTEILILIDEDDIIDEILSCREKPVDIKKNEGKVYCVFNNCGRALEIAKKYLFKLMCN